MKQTVIMILLLSYSLFSRDWHRIEGTYSYVEYQSGNEVIADSLLKIAETRLPYLQKLFDLSHKQMTEEPVRIILVDNLDVSNGFALDNVVVIYSLSSAYMPLWTGNQLWYEQVLTHELAHTLTFRKIRRGSYFLGSITNLSAPRWFFEGIAQYYSEQWNAFRGDLYLKNALFKGNLNSAALYNTNDGRLLYATGHAFTRYLADQYGDSSLVQLMSYDSTGFLYNFSDGFEETFGDPLETVFRRFIRHMVLYYGSSYADFKANPSLADFPGFGSELYQIIPLNSGDSTYVVSSRSAPFDLYRTAFKVVEKKRRLKSTKKLFENYHTPLVMSLNEKYIAFGRHRETRSDNIDGLSFDWFLFDQRKEKSIKLFSDIRARFAAFQENYLVLNETRADRSVLHKININSGNHRIIFTSHITFGRLAAIDDQRIILEGQRPNGNRDLFIFNGDSLSALTNDPVDDRLAVLVDSNRFVFTRLVNNKSVVNLYQINKDSYEVIYNDLEDYWTHAYDARTNDIVLYQWRAGFRRQNLDSLLQKRLYSDFKSNYPHLSHWSEISPHSGMLKPSHKVENQKTPESISTPYFPMEHGFSLALPVYDNDYGIGIYGLTTWFEILQRQAIAGTFLVYAKNYKRSLAFLSHLIRIYNIDLMSVYYHGPAIFSYEGSDRIDIVRDIAAFQIARPVPFFVHNRWSFTPELTLTWNRFQITGRDPFSINGTQYTSLRVGFKLDYAVKTQLFPLISKRHLGLYGSMQQTLDSEQDFKVWQSGVYAGSKLFNERLGLKTHLSYITQSGKRSTIFSVGTDRFFETNIPRDIGYTRAVRGVREDIYGDELFWISTELVLLLARSTHLKLLFIPVDNLTLSSFFDRASISGTTDADIQGFGAELTFGTNTLRMGIGYAKGQGSIGRYTEHWYWRLALLIPEAAVPR